jgi:hypothetical protein
MYQL